MCNQSSRSGIHPRTSREPLALLLDLPRDAELSVTGMEPASLPRLFPLYIRLKGRGSCLVILRQRKEHSQIYNSSLIALRSILRKVSAVPLKCKVKTAG
jgi:hypothetical protein